jgi:hypothetical protein
MHNIIIALVREEEIACFPMLISLNVYNSQGALMGTNREEESDTTNNGLILWIDVSAREDRSRLREALHCALQLSKVLAL